MKKRFELSDEQLERLYNASKPVPYMVIGGVPPASPRENAEREWARIGEEMGFDWNTVEPTGEGDKFFKADEKTPAKV